MNQQKAFVVWLTGLSGAGKSTLANLLEHKLYRAGKRTYVLDGDLIRKGLNRDLSFSPSDRSENLRRVAEVAALMVDAGIIVIAAFITPLEADRSMIKQILKNCGMIEVYLDCPLSICEGRDTKGLYAKARKGLINDFTGIGSLYEPPGTPDLKISTGLKSVEESVKEIYDFIVTLDPALPR